MMQRTHVERLVGGEQPVRELDRLRHRQRRNRRHPGGACFLHQRQLQHRHACLHQLHHSRVVLAATVVAVTVAVAAASAVVVAGA